MEMEVEMGSTKWAQHSAMGQAAASNAGACREAAGAEAEPPAAAHSAKGQAATASNLRWRVLTVDDTMFAPPQPQEGETEQRVNHKQSKKALCLQIQHIISRGAYITFVTWMQTQSVTVILSYMSQWPIRTLIRIMMDIPGG